ncbi:MAG TPA: hypothetical protein DHV56_04720 [Rhodobacter sp.]|nr:hypothetical protein [Rhodobacter sp.]
MSELPRDSIFGVTVPLDSDERLLASLTPDAGVYWRSNGVMAVVFAGLAGVALVVMQQPAPWVGPLGAVLAIGLRAAYLRSEALGEVWRLTNRRMLGPAGRIVPLSSLKEVRPFFGAVQLVTQGGDKHLVKYQLDAVSVVAAITKAKAARK